MKDVTVYSRPSCHACAEAKEYLKGKGIKFTEVDLSTSPDTMRELVKKGLRSAPVIKIGTHYIAGFSKTQIDEALAD